MLSPIQARELLLIGFALNEGRGKELGSLIDPTGIVDPLLRRVFKELSEHGSGPAIQELKRELLLNENVGLTSGIIAKVKAESERHADFWKSIETSMGRKG